MVPIEEVPVWQHFVVSLETPSQEKWWDRQGTPVMKMLMVFRRTQ
jgi:hypothetical protein